MTLISLPDLAALLSDPTHVYSVDNCAATLYLNAIRREDQNVFLLITWTDARGHECAASFAEGINQQIRRDDNVLTLIDQDDAALDLTLGVKSV